MLAPLGRGEEFEYVDCFAYVGYCQAYVSVVGEWSWVVLCCLSEVLVVCYILLGLG